MASHTVVTSSQTDFYVMPANFIAAYRVMHKDKILTEASIPGLDSDIQWWNSRGAPEEYFIDRTTQTRMGLRPLANLASTGTLTVTYYAYADDLVLATDSALNDHRRLRPFHGLLALYAAYRGWMVLGDFQLAQVYYQEYTLGVERMRALLNFGPNFQPNLSGERKR